MPPGHSKPFADGGVILSAVSPDTDKRLDDSRRIHARQRRSGREVEMPPGDSKPFADGGVILSAVSPDTDALRDKREADRSGSSATDSKGGW
ncbi:hypothetical protein RJ55_02643 [Drechmeria coniospora]|nr:hypothetical protein RJ55_02643 [Drechmeria coniospora]